MDYWWIYEDNHYFDNLRHEHLLEFCWAAAGLLIGTMYHNFHNSLEFTDYEN